MGYLTILGLYLGGGGEGLFFPITRVGGSLEGDMLEQFYEGKRDAGFFAVSVHNFIGTLRLRSFSFL